MPKYFLVIVRLSRILLDLALGATTLYMISASCSPKLAAPTLSMLVMSYSEGLNFNFLSKQ